MGLLLFALDPWRVERLYVGGVGPWIAAVPNMLTRWVPVSVAELLAVVLGVGVLWWLFTTARQLWRADAPRAAMLARAGGRIALVAATVLVVFEVVWGLSYARPPLAERFGWREADEPPFAVHTQELEFLGRDLVDRVNALYLELHGLPDGFAPTRAPRGIPDADAALERAYARMAPLLRLHPHVGRSRGRAKGLLSSPLFSWLRIGGIYVPFTAEANVNRMAPDWQQPHTIAHEKAHQRFFASENEANFMGFLACAHSDDPFVRYSGWLFAQRQVLRTLGRQEPWTFLRVIEGRLPGVQRDVNHARAFWLGYDGPMADLSRAVNDAYLRANRVEGGVRSYSQSLELIVRYARAHDGGWGTAASR